MIKKSIAATTALTSYLGLLATNAFAQINVDVVQREGQGLRASTEASTIINNLIIAVFGIAAFAVLVYIIMAAFKYITSGGNKEKTGEAQKQITAALIGMAILALSFIIVTQVGRILNIANPLQFQIPRLDTVQPGTATTP